jgi:hypothetical protein
MITPVGSILRQATRNPDGPFNILKFYASPAYDTLLCKTGHNFYFVTAENMQWDTSKNPKIPDNAFPLYTSVDKDKVTLTIPNTMDIDFVVSDSRRNRTFMDLQNISIQYHIPLIAVEHEPLRDQSSDTDAMIRSNMIADFNIFGSYDIKKTWTMFDDKNSRIMPDGSKPQEFVEYWQGIFKEAHRSIFKGE